MVVARIDGIGVWGPGIGNWADCRERLAGGRPADEAGSPPASMLSARERRRAIATGRLAVEIAEQACTAADRSVADYATVFASSAGDLATLGKICETLSADARLLSPTSFHNSVHNAPGGYWSIASGCQHSSTSLSAGCWSFAAGLLEAAAQCVVEGAPTLLVAYDLPGPAPLAEVCGIDIGFGIALALAPSGAPGIREIAVEYDAREVAHTTMADSELETMRQANPAARGLPLLAAIAAGDNGSVVLGAGSDRCLRIRLDDHLKGAE